MIPKFNLKHTLLCFFLFTISFVRAEFSFVQWDDLKNIQVSEGDLARIVDKSGSAISKNVLFGRAGQEVKYNNGSIRYVTRDLDKGKRIGLSLSESRSFNAKEMKYAFYFYKNNKVKIVTNGTSISEHIYNVGDELKIAREDNFIRFYIGGDIKHEEKVDHLENLHLQVKLLNGSTPLIGIQADFITERFKVDFNVISNEINEIDYDITGGVAPYDIEWCTGEKCFSKFKPSLPGMYTVKITDSNLNTIERRISIGEDVEWQNFDKSLQQDNSLIKNGSLSGGAWADAMSTYSFQPNSKWWVEHEIEYESSNKAIGVTPESIDINGFSSLSYGFFITKEEKQNLKIIFNGEIKKTIRYREHDIIHLEYDASLFAMNWYLNNTKVYTWKGINISVPMKIAGLVRSNSSLKEVRFLSNQHDFFSSNFNNNKGSINVSLPLDITDGPFHYMISNEPINELTEEYNFLKDSINPDLDSVLFFTGRFPENSHIFNNLTAGRYFVAIFDSKGKRISGDEILIYPNILPLTNGGVQFLNGELTTILDNSYTELPYVFNSDLNSGDFSLQIQNERKNQFYGVSKIETNFFTADDIEFGFKINNGKAFIIDNQSKQQDVFFVRKNTVFSLKNEGLILKYFIDGKEVYTSAISDNQDYKGVFGSKFPGVSAKPLPFSVFMPFDVRMKRLNSDCDTERANIGIKVIGANYSIENLSYFLYDSEENVIGSNNQTNYNNLPAGEYTILGSGILNGILYSIDLKVFVGVENTFSQSIGLNHGNVGYNAIGTLSDNKGEGVGRNKSKTNTASFISFNYLKGTVPRAEKLTLAGYPNFQQVNNEPISNQFLFKADGNKIYVNNPLTQQMSIVNYDASKEIIISKQNNGTYKIIQGQQTLHNGMMSNQRWITWIQNIGLNTGFQFIHTSFGCKSSSDTYASLDYEMDGYYHVMKNGKINFVFNQEYDDANLIFNIYNKNDILIKDQSDYPDLFASNKLNYLTIDVSGEDCIGKGFFYLEVINSKKEKSYLRFFNDYSNINCTTQDPGDTGPK